MGEFSPPPPFSEPPSSPFFSYPSNIEIMFDFSDIITKSTPPFQNPGSALESSPKNSGAQFQISWFQMLVTPEYMLELFYYVNFAKWKTSSFDQFHVIHGSFSFLWKEEHKIRNGNVMKHALSLLILVLMHFPLFNYRKKQELPY